MNSNHDREGRKGRGGRPNFKGEQREGRTGHRERKGDRSRSEGARGRSGSWKRDQQSNHGERSRGRSGSWKPGRKLGSSERGERQSEGFSQNRRFEKADRPGERIHHKEQRVRKYDERTPAHAGVDPHPSDPVLPDEVTADMLDGAMRRHLMTLSKENAETVARHLVMAGALLAEDPAAAHAHAQAAQRHGGRVGIVREALAMTAYHTGEYALAVREIHAFRRLTGTEAHQVIEADCQRGLGRPERALDVIAHTDKNRLRDDFRVELTLVESGARADLRQYDAGLLAIDTELQQNYPPELRARLLAVRADRLEDLGRTGEAERARAEALSADPAVFGDIGPDGQELDDELLLVEDE